MAFDLIVIGAGAAGMSAAGEAARGGLRVASMESSMFGGLVLNINELSPGIPGLPHSGAELASGMLAEAAELGVESIGDGAAGLKAADGAFVVIGAEGRRHGARAVVVASGARLRKLGVPGEAEYEHRGVAICADCDGPMYRGKRVAVVGGGDSALQEALVLASFCERVYLIHRGAGPSGGGAFVEALAGRANIVPRWDTRVEEIVGTRNDGVTGVRVRAAGGAPEVIDCAGVFSYVGLEPNVEFLPQGIARDASGRVTTDAALHTSMPGIFAAGAVRSGCGGLLTDAIADGRQAAASAAAYLKAQG